MFSRAIWALSIIGTLMTYGAGAQDAPQMGCAKWGDMNEALKKEYKEEPTGPAGLIGDKVMIQVYLSPNGATFTVVAIKADGMACPVASGTDWIDGKAPAAETF